MHRQRTVCRRGFVAGLFLLTTMVAAPGCYDETAPPAAVQKDPMLEFLKTAVLWPDRDTGAIVILAGLYEASGRNRDAYNFFRAAAAANPEHGVFLAYEGLFKARVSGEIELTQRVPWVRDAIRVLDAARDLDPTLPRFLRAAVLAQLPERFECAWDGINELDAIFDDEESFIYTEVDESTRQSLTRVAWQSRAAAYETLGRSADAADAWRRAGGKPPAGAPALGTQFNVTQAEGFRFQSTYVYEPIAGLHVARGFDFGNIAFIETTDGLVVIDAGTIPENASNALEAVRTIVGDQPIHTVFITHAHWDHIGGVESLLEPQTRLVVAEHFHKEMAIVNEAAIDYMWFFGPTLVKDSPEPIFDFSPDTFIEEGTTEMVIGQYTFTLHALEGGETEDQMLIEVDLGPETVMFVGDAFMPYLGAPFVNEGNPEALIDTIDLIVERDPTLLIHGHPPLTENFPAEVMKPLGDALRVARDSVIDGVIAVTPISETIRDTPVPTLLKDHPRAIVPLFAMWFQFMQRLHRIRTGYWQADFEGIEVITPQAWAGALDLLAGNDEDRWVSTIEDLLRRGDLGLAWRLSEYALQKYDSAELWECRKQALHRLRARYQSFNPFKLIVFSELVGVEQPMLPLVDPDGAPQG